jgi:gluconolactonase
MIRARTRGMIAAFLCLAACRLSFAQDVVPPAIDETVPAESNNYSPGPDSKVQPGVATGRTLSFEIKNSKVFPATTRKITVYVPAAYHGDKPACVYVGLDGLGFNAATVFDNLIAKHEMPVAIAIGVASGEVPSANPPENPRFDRSFEFDSRSDKLASFLLEEVMPEVERQAGVKLSTDPNDRAIGGGSTGAIAAFTVAWERPDAFRRVFSAIGTYVGMRGGEQYYVLVRKTEPKPLRLFVEDGVHDEWPGGPEMGDWWMSNLTMNRALEFAGYDVRHVWGAGSHNGAQATAVFPDAMRWLWRDWPAPVEAKAPGNPTLQQILIPGETWQQSDGAAPAGLAADPRRTTGNRGDVYTVTESELWLIRSSGEKVRLDDGLKGASGVALSPDGLWLFVSQSQSRRGLSYRVKADGTVDAKESFYDFYVPAWADDSGAGQIAMDREGRAYVATRMGIQIFDHNGRVTAILPLPDNAAASGVAFGGEGFETLYVSAGAKVYHRKLRVPGLQPGATSEKVPNWGAG